MSEQKLWDKVYFKGIAAQLDRKEPLDHTSAQFAADDAIKRRRESIATRSPEPVPAKPAKVKRGASARLPCPGGGEKRSKDAGYLKCNGCGRVVGTARGRGGWYAAEHKLPLEVGR
jgi:hypothetical protein